MNKAKTTNRRNFLLAAGLGSAGVAAAVVTAGKAVKKAEGVAPDAPEQTAYRETDHIRKYYKTTQV